MYKYITHSCCILKRPRKVLSVILCSRLVRRYLLIINSVIILIVFIKSYRNTSDCSSENARSSTASIKLFDNTSLCNRVSGENTLLEILLIWLLSKYLLYKKRSYNNECYLFYSYTTYSEVREGVWMKTSWDKVLIWLVLRTLL